MGRIDILENKEADFLASSTKNIFPSDLFLYPYSDVILFDCKFIYKLWLLNWENLNASYLANFKLISPNLSFRF